MKSNFITIERAILESKFIGTIAHSTQYNEKEKIMTIYTGFSEIGEIVTIIKTTINSKVVYEGQSLIDAIDAYNDKSEAQITMLEALNGIHNLSKLEDNDDGETHRDFPI